MSDTELERLRAELERQKARADGRWGYADELNRLRAERDDLAVAFEAECKRAEDHYAWYVKALAERDEAVATLREIRKVANDVQEAHDDEVTVDSWWLRSFIDGRLK